jgi:hypothetical protein
MNYILMKIKILYIPLWLFKHTFTKPITPVSIDVDANINWPYHS